jgi:hypothetical protein
MRLKQDFTNFLKWLVVKIICKSYQDINFCLRNVLNEMKMVHGMLLSVLLVVMCED